MLRLIKRNFFLRNQLSFCDQILINIGIASASTNYWGPIYAMEKRDVSGGTVPPEPVVPSGSITVTAQVNIVYLYL